MSYALTIALSEYLMKEMIPQPICNAIPVFIFYYLQVSLFSFIFSIITQAVAYPISIVVGASPTKIYCIFT